MAIDIRQSRLEFTDRCKWYKGVASGNTYAKDPTCCGVFYAKESAPEIQSNEQIGTVLIIKISTSIRTPDIVTGLAPNDFVEYNGETWAVTAVQRAETRVSSRKYAINAPLDTIIQLRR